MISIFKSTDCCNDARNLAPEVCILINIFYSTRMAHSDLKILQLIFEPMTPEPLPAGELLEVRRFISNFFLNHYINNTGDNEGFSMAVPETMSKHSTRVSTIVFHVMRSSYFIHYDYVLHLSINQWNLASICSIAYCCEF